MYKLANLIIQDLQVCFLDFRNHLVWQLYQANVVTSGDYCKIIDHNANDIFKHDPSNDKSPYQIEHDKLFASIRNGGVINDAEYGAKSTLTAIS